MAGRLLFVIGVAAQACLKGVYQMLPFGGADGAVAYRAFGRLAELGEEVVRLVFDVAQHVRYRVAFDFADKIKAAVFVDVHRDNVGVAEQVVQVAEGFLVGADEECAEVVFFAFADFV